MRILTLLAMGLCACGGDPLNGKWTEPNGTIATSTGTVNFNATVTFTSSNNSFDVVMVLTGLGGALNDTVEAKGTYKDSGNNLTMTTTGFLPAANSGDTTSVGSDGSQCIAIKQTGGLPLCFASPQTNPYTITGGTLTTSLQNTLNGTAGTPITLSLTKSS